MRRRDGVRNAARAVLLGRPLAHALLRVLPAAGAGEASADEEEEAMTRLPDMPPADRFPHGTRSRYVSGCRCDACRGSNTAYYHERQRRAKELARAIDKPAEPREQTWTAPDGSKRTRIYRRACPGVGRRPCPILAHLRKDSKGGVCSVCRERLVWNGLVSTRRARKHLAVLSAAGVGYKTVGAACDVGHTVLAEIISGRKRKIRQSTEARVLSVTAEAIADHALVDAGPTWALLNELVARGFTRAEIAQRLGFTTLALQFRRNRVLARTALAVGKLYRSLGDASPASRFAARCSCERPLELTIRQDEPVFAKNGAGELVCARCELRLPARKARAA